MNEDKLSETLQEHKQWLHGDAGGKRAYLRRANLQDANLRDAVLLGADLREADLQDADLQGADLRDAYLRHANLKGADLQGADLQDADLQGADLRDANLDFSCWPLWCGSLDVKVDVRIARQLAYHFCRLDCDDPEYQAVREAVKDFANKFHRVKECGEIKTTKEMKLKTVMATAADHDGKEN